MDVNFKPRLRHCTLIDNPSGNSTTLVVGTDYFELTREAGDRDDFLHLKSLMDGRHNLAEISQETGIAIENVLAAIRAFSDSGLLQTRTGAEKIEKVAFLEKVEATSLMWRRQIGLHRLFSGLSSKYYRREVLIGLLLETYQYVKSLSPLLLKISEDWPPSRIKDIVVHYANEEIDHHLSYAEALEDFSRLTGRISDSHPTIGTLALLRGFESVGRRSELALVCCLQLVEARPSEMNSAENHLTQIAENYGLAELIGPYVNHMKADLDLGHSNLLADALREVNSLDLREANEAVNDMHDIKHFFDVFHDNVVYYYQDISNYIPRPRVDYFAL